MSEKFICNNINFRSKNQAIFALIEAYCTYADGKFKNEEVAKRLEGVLELVLPKQDFDRFMQSREIPLSYLRR